MMKPAGTADDDSALHAVLREWKLDATLPPRFQEQVWQQIAREEAQAAPGLWARFRQWTSQALARPGLAAGYVSVLLLAGMAAGYWQGQTEKARALETLGARYVQMMDPYRMPRH